MEKTVFDVRSEVSSLKMMDSKSLKWREGGRRFSRQYLRFYQGGGGGGGGGGGLSIKSSYPTARTSSEGIDLVSPQKLSQSEISRINGNNCAVSSSSSYREGFILDAFEDEYGGVIVNPERLPHNANVFSSVLQTSLSHWKLKGRKGVWLKLPVERSELVPVAIKEGFNYHHAEQSYVMLTYWIPDGPCSLPANASHQVGVGGFVINEKDEVLVVQEKHCALGGVWKIPTGFINESEEIFAGAVREVKEETGIDTEFLEVIAFRSSQLIIAYDPERGMQWMPLVEFLEQPFVQGDCMIKKIIDICIARLGKRYCGLAAHKVISKFDGRSSSLYYNVAQPQDSYCQSQE
ncbi:uncharacterized protein A4U43_C04F32350 [Asparagus officinalis]|uniref:Nudix hydrolase domain-containing protein n=1 Tax=Asparagus officinalis TaxID=4686 RepID=A0A5P1F7Y7_ASPOF|nr:uncharacterized protein A4U43_C04F32350 [Asparagus officinalis]